jgi:hypothetical protein
MGALAQRFQEAINGSLQQGGLLWDLLAVERRVHNAQRPLHSIDIFVHRLGKLVDQTGFFDYWWQRSSEDQLKVKVEIMHDTGNTRPSN